ncbi:MAG: MFS transporter [Acidimicrobiales bacterium]
MATAEVLPVFLTGALAVQLEASLHVGATAVGGAVATFFGASALSSVRAGRLAERVGPFRVMLVAVGLALLALVGIGLVVTSLAGLLGFLVVAGLSNGTMQPAVNLLLSRAVDDHRQGLAFGVKQAAIPTATLLSGLAVPALAVTAGWHAAYLAAGGLVLLIGSVLVLGGRPLMPEPATSEPATSEPATSEPATSEPVTSEPATSAPTTLGRADSGVSVSSANDALEPDLGGAADRPEVPKAKSGAGFDARPLVSLGAAMAFAVAASNALGSFVVPGAVHDGVAPGLAGLLSAAGSVVGLSARVGVGWRADRRDAGRDVCRRDGRPLGLRDRRRPPRLRSRMGSVRRVRRSCRGRLLGQPATSSGCTGNCPRGGRHGARRTERTPGADRRPR